MSIEYVKLPKNFKYLLCKKKVKLTEEAMIRRDSFPNS